MIRKSLLALAALALASTTALAANDIGATVSKDGLKTMVPQGAVHTFVRGGIRDPKLTEIFSDIGVKYPKGLYFCCYGGTIGGPTSQVGQIWQAEAFTPTANATVTEIDAGVGFVSGVNGVTVGLYTDASGVPGTALISKDATGLGAFGACCALVAVKDKTGAAVTAGTQYWVVISTDKKTTTTWDAWNMNSTDQVDPIPFASNSGSGWTGGFSTTPAYSFAVLGH
jgi:hypothetical protein